MVCDKSNEAPEFKRRWLIQQRREPLPDGSWLDVGGTLRLASDVEASVLNDASGRSKPDSASGKESRVSGPRKALLDAIVGALPVEPDSTSLGALIATLTMNGVRVSDHTLKGCLEYLASPANGKRVIDLSCGSRGAPRKWCLVRPESKRPSETPPITPPCPADGRWKAPAGTQRPKSVRSSDGSDGTMSPDIDAVSEELESDE